MPGIHYRATINDNVLVTVMIETLAGLQEVRRKIESWIAS